MENREESAMVRVRELFERSGLTLEVLGEKMGYKGKTARQSLWQFLNRTTDPRLSMLRRFCEAVGVTLAELFAEPETKKGRSR